MITRYISVDREMVARNKRKVDAAKGLVEDLEPVWVIEYDDGHPDVRAHKVEFRGRMHVEGVYDAYHDEGTSDPNAKAWFQTTDWVWADGIYV